MINYTGLAANPKLGFVIDVKGIKIISGNVQLVDVGWTYLPIYGTLENENNSSSLYCNSGLHAVRVFINNFSLASSVCGTSTSWPYNVCLIESECSSTVNERPI